MNERLLAIGDIHGCFNKLKALIEEKIVLRKQDKIVFIGDYIDRGNQSKEVVDFLIHLQEEKYEIILLMGNHEAMLLDALNDEESVSKWIQNGGNETLLSFGVNSLKSLNSKYIKFFKELKPYYSAGNFLFVHAGFNDSIENPFTDTYQMLWSRNEIYNHPLLLNKIIIHGHTPITEKQCQQLIALKKTTINIDTGCVYSGYSGYGHLTALDLYSYNLFSV
jgi:serine/threonine protein phosphatase 1